MEKQSAVDRAMLKFDHVHFRLNSDLRAVSIEVMGATSFKMILEEFEPIEPEEVDS